MSGTASPSSLLASTITQYVTLKQALGRCYGVERDVLHAANALAPTPATPLRPQVFRFAIVLLFTTGMRRGELLRLTLDDYDPREGTLLVRESKFHKSRLLPLSSDGLREIEGYLEA